VRRTSSPGDRGTSASGTVTVGPLVVGEPRRFRQDGAYGVAATVELAGRCHEIWYTSTAGPLADDPEVFLAAALLPAMRCGVPVQIPRPVSVRLLRATARIGEILHAWDPALERVPVDAAGVRVTPGVAGRGIGLFFSGGVDSFYSLLKHQERVTHLIFAHGFDVPLENRALRARISEALRGVAADLGKPLIEVDTNLREFSDAYTWWSRHYHGAALASVALLLGRQLQRAYVASTYPISHLIPWGSHPAVDPLWSTELMEIVHDGCEATRLEKTAAIANWELALRRLRVCFENPDGTYNCGRCEKCVRTMVHLRLAGGLDRCPAFAQPLDLDRLVRLRIPDHNREYFAESLAVLERTGRDPALARALRSCLIRQRWIQRWDVMPRALARLRRAMRTAGAEPPAMTHTWQR